jgi:hypothetical protein
MSSSAQGEDLLAEFIDEGLDVARGLEESVLRSAGARGDSRAVSGILLALQTIEGNATAFGFRVLASVVGDLCCRTRRSTGDRLSDELAQRLRYFGDKLRTFFANGCPHGVEREVFGELLETGSAREPSKSMSHRAEPSRGSEPEIDSMRESSLRAILERAPRIEPRIDEMVTRARAELARESDCEQASQVVAAAPDAEPVTATSSRRIQSGPLERIEVESARSDRGGRQASVPAPFVGPFALGVNEAAKFAEPARPLAETELWPDDGDSMERRGARRRVDSARDSGSAVESIDPERVSLASKESVSASSGTQMSPISWSSVPRGSEGVEALRLRHLVDVLHSEAGSGANPRAAIAWTRASGILAAVLERCFSVTELPWRCVFAEDAEILGHRVEFRAASGGGDSVTLCPELGRLLLRVVREICFLDTSPTRVCSPLSIGLSRGSDGELLATVSAQLDTGVYAARLRVCLLQRRLAELGLDVRSIESNLCVVAFPKRPLVANVLFIRGIDESTAILRDAVLSCRVVEVEDVQRQSREGHVVFRGARIRLGEIPSSLDRPGVHEVCQIILEGSDERVALFVVGRPSEERAIIDVSPMAKGEWALCSDAERLRRVPLLVDAP